MKEITFPIPVVHFVDGPKRGELIEARARRCIAWVNYGKVWGWREACYDLQYNDEENFFYYTFRGFMDDMRWQEKYPAPGLPGWIDVPVREKSPTPLRNPQEEEQSKPRSGTYICATCKQEFEFDPDWSEEDALTEYADNFPREMKEDIARICDDCYKEFLPWHEKLPPH